MANNAIHIKDFRTEIPGKLEGDRWVFPSVITTTASGRQSAWNIYVRLVSAARHDEFQPIDDSYFDSKPMAGAVGWIKVDSGLIGGKIKKSEPTFVYKGLNAGKVSATNVWTQALRDAYGLYNKQRKKTQGNHNITAGIPLYPPMLAHNIKDTPVTVDDDHPVFIQRKYNGVRGITAMDPDNAANPVIMTSRKKNLYPGFAYIKKELQPVLNMFIEDGRPIYFDGELYGHGIALQDISGYSRREDQANDIKLTYMIYDCYIPTEPDLRYSERKAILEGIFEDFQFEHCQLVETFVATSMDEVNELYQVFLEEKFEGAMIRLDGPYQVSNNDYRSKYLIKMKPTYDAEFSIVGWETGRKGKAASALMIICEARDESGKSIKFPVTPTGEIPAREALARKMAEIEPNGKTHFENHWLGKPLIVTFDEYSKNQVPQRARTDLKIRDWD